MSRKRNRREIWCTTPDHRPMLPEFRQPENLMEEAIRANRRRREDIDPEKQMKWR